MKGDDVGPTLGKVWNDRIHGLYHQMDVKRFFGVGLDGGYHRWPDSEIGHEVVVHHIDVDVIGPGRIHGPDLFA